MQMPLNRRGLIVAAVVMCMSPVSLGAFAQTAPDSQAVSEGAPMSNTPTRPPNQTSGTQATKEIGPNGQIIPGHYRMTVPDTGTGGQSGWRPRKFGEGEYKIDKLKATGRLKVRSMGTDGSIQILDSPPGDYVVDYDVVDKNGTVVEHVHLKVRVAERPRRPPAKGPGAVKRAPGGGGSSLLLERPGGE